MSKSQKVDRIGIVEESYALEGDDLAWTSKLLHRVMPYLDRGMGGFAYLCGPRGEVRPETIVARMAPEIVAMIGRLPAVEPTWCRQANTAPAILTTLSEDFSITPAQTKRHEPHVRYLHPVGVCDLLAFKALGASSSAIVAAPMPDLRRPTARDRARWSQIAAHVSTGLRLRHKLRAAANERSKQPQAVVDPKRGSVVHAEGDAREATALQSLRDAARAMDRARGRLRRRDEDEALELWRALVAGQWSLVDQFESDGRRFLVAHRNDPDVISPRGLTLRERQVLALAAFGHPLKLIAYELGLSVSTVSLHRTSAMRKLGIRTLAELVALRS